MGACNELNRRRNVYSATLQISAILHKLLPVHPTGHMLRVHIFDVGDTNASSYQQLTVYGANHMYLQCIVLE